MKEGEYYRVFGFLMTAGRFTPDRLLSISLKESK